MATGSVNILLFSTYMIIQEFVGINKIMNALSY